MFKRNTQIDSTSLRSLTDAEIEFVVGGVMAGPNGEGCTRPGRPPKGGTTTTTSSGILAQISVY